MFSISLFLIVTSKYCLDFSRDLFKFLISSFGCDDLKIISLIIIVPKSLLLTICCSKMCYVAGTLYNPLSL